MMHVLRVKWIVTAILLLEYFTSACLAQLVCSMNEYEYCNFVYGCQCLPCPEGTWNPGHSTSCITLPEAEATTGATTKPLLPTTTSTTATTTSHNYQSQDEPQSSTTVLPDPSSTTSAITLLNPSTAMAPEYPTTDASESIDATMIILQGIIIIAALVFLGAGLYLLSKLFKKYANRCNTTGLAVKYSLGQQPPNAQLQTEDSAEV